MRRSAWVCFCFLLGCGGTAATVRPDSVSEAPRVATEDPAILRASREPSAREAEVLGRLIALTARVRGLAPIHPVVARVASSEAIARHLTDNLEEEELVELVDLYVSIGMLAPSDDVVGILARVVGEQVVGFYDPKLDLLILREDVTRSLASGTLDPEGLITIAHEVVHALQGQHLQLRERMEAEVDVDAADAYQALVEGDATLGMMLVAAEVAHVPLSQLLDGVSGDVDFAGGELGGAGSEELAAAPPIIRIGMTAPYVAGLRFCAALHEHGGYASVDAAHASLPTTTEQVMHPEKYLAREGADAIDLGPLAAIEAAGYRRVAEDSLGELEVGIYLGRGTPRGYDPAAGEGWGGDRVRAYRRGDALASVFVVSFDTEQDAIEAEAAAHSADALAPRTLERTGRLLLATQGLDGAALEAARARAREIATSLPGRTR